MVDDPKQNSSQRIIYAEDIMTEDVQVIDQKVSIVEVAHLMLRIRVSAYPVVDDNKKVVGIVTLTDMFKLLNNIIKENRLASYTSEQEKQNVLHQQISQWRDSPVSRIMSGQVVFISPRTPIYEIVEKVATLNIHTFPVIDNGQLVGVIGRHDVLNATFMYA